MLLKMRNLPPKTQARPEDGVLVPVEGSEEAVNVYFDTIRISSKSRPAASIDISLCSC